MKKFLIGLSVLGLMTGCGTANKNLSCATSTTANGITSKTTYMITYNNKDVKHVTVTYDYKMNDVDGVNADTDGLTDGDSGNATQNNDSKNADIDATTGNNANADVSGSASNSSHSSSNANADMSGNSAHGNANRSANNEINKNDRASDKVIDGIVGNAIDGAVDAVTDTILDLSGIRSKHINQMNTYGDIDGFTSKVEYDSGNEYKIVYEIDMSKISDDDLDRLNIDRDFSKFRSSIEDTGYVCE